MLHQCLAELTSFPKVSLRSLFGDSQTDPLDVHLAELM